MMMTLPNELLKDTPPASLDPWDYHVALAP